MRPLIGSRIGYLLNRLTIILICDLDMPARDYMWPTLKIDLPIRLPVFLT